MEASATRMPLGSVQLSGAGASKVLASDCVRLRPFLLVRRTGRPRSSIDDSDIFLLCDAVCVAMGSRFSTLGEPRRSSAPGDPALKGFEMADRGVGSGPFTFGDRLLSSALGGVIPPEWRVDGVISCVLLDFGLSLRGLGELLRSAGDFGGTSGGNSSASITAVSTFNVGFMLTPGLRIGDNGLHRVIGASVLPKTLASR
jgi:hypothetical protein